MRLTGALAAIGFLAAVLATACGGGGEKSAVPTAAPQQTPTAVPRTQYPLTVTDMLGRSVTIQTAPTAVAALSPTTVEYVYAVGGTSVTRSSSVRYPEAATSAVDIGPSYQPNFEIVAAQKPDLIIADSVIQPQLVENLQALNVPVLYAGAEGFDDVIKGLRLVGQVLDHSAEAESLVGDFNQEIAHLKDLSPAQKPKVLILNGTPSDFFAAKPESYVGNLVDLLGGQNVAAGAPDVGRFPGYTKLSLESILASAPDVVLAITAGPPGGTTITGSLSSNPAWAEVPAVKNGRVSEISAEIYLQAPGPRVGDALAELAKLLYPEVFGS